MIDRRNVLIGGALWCVGTAARAGSDVRAQLDDAAKAEGKDRLGLLRRISRRGLSPAELLDLDAALRGAELEAALSENPEPQARYALRLRLQSGVDATPGALFAWASDRVRGIGQRLDRLLRAEGLAAGSVADRLRLLARDPNFLYPDSDAGRDRAVEDMNRWLEAARRRLPEQFGTIPAAVNNVVVSRMSHAEEQVGKPGYRTLPSFDGSVPGTYFVDLHDIARRPIWSLPSVVHHETLPGHLLQLPLQAHADPHPLRLRAAAGFVEGWGIYAEQLAAEAGAFARDGRAEIGYLQWLLFRLGRAMIDVGLNRMGWTDQHARDFLTELQGDPMVFAPFDKDIAKARSDPGGFAAHALNWRGFARLRAAAFAAGQDVRGLHDRLLANGAFPLALFGSS